jgi:hypothetical protein
VQAILEGLAFWRSGGNVLELIGELVASALQVVELIGQLTTLRLQALVNRARAGRSSTDGHGSYRLCGWCGCCLYFLQSILVVQSTAFHLADAN